MGEELFTETLPLKDTLEPFKVANTFVKGETPSLKLLISTLIFAGILLKLNALTTGLTIKSIPFEE